MPFFDVFGYNKRFDKIEAALQYLISQGVKVMQTLDDVLALVAAEDTKIDSIGALILGLKQQVADALSGVTLPPDVQAKVQNIFDKAKANSDKIDAAIASGTTPAPTP